MSEESAPETPNSSKRVRIRRVDDSEFEATAVFSNGRRKMDSVAVYFDNRVWVTYDRRTTDGYWSNGAEFYLAKHDCAIMVWGQGNEFPRDVLRLHPDDAAEILNTGGG